jgi:hypothetical protein
MLTLILLLSGFPSFHYVYTQDSDQAAESPGDMTENQGMPPDAGADGQDIDENVEQEDMQNMEGDTGDIQGDVGGQDEQMEGADMPDESPDTDGMNDQPEGMKDDSGKDEIKDDSDLSKKEPDIDMEEDAKKESTESDTKKDAESDTKDQSESQPEDKVDLPVPPDDAELSAEEVAQFYQEGIDTEELIDSGNWFVKRKFWRKAKPVYEDIRARVAVAESYQDVFFNKKSDLFKRIHEFFQNSGVTLGSLDQSLKTLKESLESAREEVGLDRDKQAVLERVEKSYKELELLRQDYELIDTIQSNIQQVFDKFSDQVSLVNSYEQRAYSVYKHIGEILDHEKASALYQSLENILENIDLKIDYIEKNLQDYMSYLEKEVDEIISESDNLIKELKERGVSLKDKKDESEDDSSEDAQEKAPEKDEDTDKDMPREDVKDNDASQKADKADTRTWFDTITSTISKPFVYIYDMIQGLFSPQQKTRDKNSAQESRTEEDDAERKDVDTQDTKNDADTEGVDADADIKENSKDTDIKNMQDDVDPDMKENTES